MDDQTALWLLSALLQGMATLWGLVVIALFFYFGNVVRQIRDLQTWGVKSIYRP